MDSSNNAIRAFQGMAEAMRAPACFVDPQGVVLFSNSDANRAGVFIPNDLIFKSLPPHSSSLFEKLLGNAASTNKESSENLRWESEQSPLDFLVSVTPLYVLNRQLFFIALHPVKSVSAIDELQAAPAAKNATSEPKEKPSPVIDAASMIINEEQKRIQQECTNYLSLIDSTKEVLALFDLTGKPIFINLICKEIFGWNLSVATIAEYVTPTTAQKYFKEVFPALLKNGKAWEGEVEIINKNTTEIVPVLQRIFLILDSEGNPIYFGTTATDRRDHQASERALAQAAKMSALGSMAGGIAHEINNPLAIIYGKSCQIRKLASRGDISPSELVSELEKVEQTALRISRIVKGLRSFARNGEQDPRIQATLNSIVDETLTFCQERFRNHGIELNVAQIPKVAINCRAVQISQVLLNLLNNAFDAVEPLEQRWVDVQFEQEDGRIILSVVDSGSGVAPNIATRMMDPFFTTKEAGRGSGLGLSIAKGIIEEHGGSLYYSPLDGHTRFVVTLPTQEAGRKAVA